MSNQQLTKGNPQRSQPQPESISKIQIGDELNHQETKPQEPQGYQQNDVATRSSVGTNESVSLPFERVGSRWERCSCIALWSAITCLIGGITCIVLIFAGPCNQTKNYESSSSSIRWENKGSTCCVQYKSNSQNVTLEACYSKWDTYSAAKALNSFATILFMLSVNLLCLTVKIYKNPAFCQ